MIYTSYICNIYKLDISIYKIRDIYLIYIALLKDFFPLFLFFHFFLFSFGHEPILISAQNYSQLCSCVTVRCAKGTHMVPRNKLGF